MLLQHSSLWHLSNNSPHLSITFDCHIRTPQTPHIFFSSSEWLSLLERAHIWSAPTVICSLMDTGMLAILKLPEWLVSTDGWGLMPPHNDVPALFKVTAFRCGGLQQGELQGKRCRGLVSCSGWNREDQIAPLCSMWKTTCENTHRHKETPHERVLGVIS